AAAGAPADALRADLQRQVFERLASDGSQSVVRRLLEGGLDFRLTAGTGRRQVRETVHIELDLGDPNPAPPATTRASEWVPIGFKGVGGRGGGDHIAVEADHESTSGVGRSVTASRSLGVTGNIAWAFGGLPNKVFNPLLGIGISGSGTNKSSLGNDA